MARGDETPMPAQAAVMIDPPAVRSVVRVEIAQIDATQRLREISEAHAQVIAASMLEHEERGGRRQLQAVELVQRGDGYRLVFGAHRLRAHQINGWDEIDAEIVTATDAELRLREIDENLIRHELTALDRARFLSERKRLYEAMNPTAKHGGDRRSDQAANVATWSFSADIAEKTGLSERTVQRACEIASNLAPAAIDRLRDTPMASNQKALEALSKHPHERQLAALDHLFAAENPAPSVNAAFDRLDGKAVKPAAELKVSKIVDLWGRQGAPAFLPVSPLRGDWGAFNLRLDVTGYRLGTVQASDLYICDVIQPLSGALATAVAVDHRPIPMTLFYGQSNAGRAGGAVINGGAVYPHHALMFSEGIAHIQSTIGGPLDGYGAPVTPGALSDLAPLRDNGQSVQGSHVAGLAAVAAEAMDREAGRRSPARLWRSDYFGGQPLGQFVKGTTMYANALTSASQARVAAARYGRSVSLDFLVFVHGESGPYPYPLANLLDDLLPDLKAAADQDQAPFVILAQTNTGDVNVTTGVETAQLDYAKAHAATTALIPMYDLPLLSDDIHPTAEGRAIFGERVAWVQDQVTHGDGFDGVWPVSAVRTGASLVVTFNHDIAADPRDWTLPVPSLGFTYTGASITAATVTGAREVTLTLSAAAAGTLHYANQQTADDDNGWSSQRGLIVHRTGAASPWQSRGLGVPAEIVVPAARFSMPIA